METNEQLGAQPSESTSPEPLAEPKPKFRVQQWEKIGAVAAVILVLGYVTLAQNLKFWPFTVSVAPLTTPTTSPSTSSGQFNETSNWQTYRNDEYGFEIKYPPSFQLREFVQSGYFTLQLGSNLCEDCLAELAISVKNSSLEEERNFINSWTSGGIISEYTINLNGNNYTVFKYTWLYGEGFEAAIFHNGKLYLINTYGRDPSQVLSTFKFIEP